MSAVKVRYLNNLLAISPASALEKLLAPLLTWNRRERNPLAFRGRKRVPGQRVVKIVEEPLYQVVPSSDEIVTFAGLLPRLQDWFHHTGIEYELIDETPGRKYEPDNKDIGYARAGQQEAIEVIWNNDRAQIVCPTAWGKTQLISMACLSYTSKDIAVVAPGIEAVKNIYNRLCGRGIDVGIVHGAKKQKGRRVTVCSADCLMHLDPDAVDILFFDEVHRAAATCTRNALTRFHKARMFGLTASPEGRSDNGEIVIEALFGPVGFTMSYADAAEAGSVSPMVVIMVENPGTPCEIDNPTEKSRIAIWRNDQRNQLLCNIAAEVSKLGQTLVISSVLEHCFKLKKYLPEWPVVYGATPDASPDEDEEGNKHMSRTAKRAKSMLETMQELGISELSNKDRSALALQFATGELQKAIATYVWSTAVDFPSLQFVIRCDGTSSRIYSTQIPGRAARIADNKTCGIVIDCEDDFDEGLSRRKASRLKVYKDKSWTIYRHIPPTSVAHLCEKLISQEATSITESPSATALFTEVTESDSQTV